MITANSLTIAGSEELEMAYRSAIFPFRDLSTPAYAKAAQTILHNWDCFSERLLAMLPGPMQRGYHLLFAPVDRKMLQAIAREAAFVPSGRFITFSASEPLWYLETKGDPASWNSLTLRPKPEGVYQAGILQRWNMPNVIAAPGFRPWAPVPLEEIALAKDHLIVRGGRSEPLGRFVEIDLDTCSAVFELANDIVALTWAEKVPYFKARPSPLFDELYEEVNGQ